MANKKSTYENQNHSSTKSLNLLVINQIEMIIIYKELSIENSSEFIGIVSHRPSFAQSPENAPQATRNRLDEPKVPPEVSLSFDGIDP
jgi:hypothetical protein